MAYEAKLHNPSHSTSEALAVQQAVGEWSWRTGPFLLTKTGCRHLEHVINLLGILLRCNGFTRIQKAAVAQNISRSPNSDSDLFWGASLALGSNSELLLGPATLSGRHQLSYKIHFPSQITIQQRNGSLLLHRMRQQHFKAMIFFICIRLMRHPLIKLFHLSNLLQALNDCRMANAEFFSNFSCSCKRISFDDGSQLLSTSDGWPRTPHFQGPHLLCKTS